MASVRTTASNTSATDSVNVSITPASGDLFVVFVACANADPVTWSVTDDNGSGTYTLLESYSAYTGGAYRHIACYARDSLLGNTTATSVSVSSTGNFTSEATCAIVYAIASMIRYGSFAKRSSGQAYSYSYAAPSVTLNQAALTGNPTLGGVVSDVATAGNTAPTSWTEDQEIGANGGSYDAGLETVSRASGFTGSTITWTSNAPGDGAAIAVELDTSAMPPNNGALTQTLDALTSTATGTVQFRGTVSSTLDALTSSATGKVVMAGASAQTLDALSVTATGLVGANLVDATLADLTSVATGVVLVQGAAAQTLDALSLSAAGGHLGVEQTLESLSLSATGQHRTNGASSSTLGTLSCVAEATKQITYNWPAQPEVLSAQKPELGEFDLFLDE